jgi:hypothetical protein
MAPLPAPRNPCVPPCRPSRVEASAPTFEDESLGALRALAGPGCYLCLLDEFADEDWD